MNADEMQEYKENYELEKTELEIQFLRMKTYGEMQANYITMFVDWICTGFLGAMLRFTLTNDDLSKGFTIVVLVGTIVSLLATIFVTIIILKFYIPCSVEDKEAQKSKETHLISPDKLRSLLSGENADFVIEKCREVMKNDKPLYFEDLHGQPSKGGPANAGK